MMLTTRKTGTTKKSLVDGWIVVWYSYDWAQKSVTKSAGISDLLMTINEGEVGKERFFGQ